MYKLLTVFLLSLVLQACNQDEIQLFNGKNLDGWEMILADENIDPASIFTVQNGVINISGSSNGYLRTNKVYNNYQLHLEWRWTEEPTNSGLLLHVNGYEFWPNCIEAQLQNQNAGDIVLIGYGVSGTIADSSYINTGKRYEVIEKYNESNEKPAGEWNSYDIICKKDQISIKVNGVLQNEAKNLSLNGGSIGLQSEGSPIEFRNIILKPIN